MLDLITQAEMAVSELIDFGGDRATIEAILLMSAQVVARPKLSRGGQNGPLRGG